MSDKPWSECKGGVSINVRLTPKSSREELCGTEQLSDGRVVLKARVRANPEKGEANAALLGLLAGALCMSRSDITLTSGSASRLKTLKISGDSAMLKGKLDQLMRSGSRLPAGQSEKRQNRK